MFTRWRAALSLLLLCLSFSLLSGCSKDVVPPVGASATAENAAQAQTFDVARSNDFNIVIDFTGSPVEMAIQEAWENCKRDLPRLIETHNVQRVSVWGFDGDGWQLKNLKTIVLPSAAPKTESEYTSFGNVQQAVDEVDVSRRHRALEEALKPLDALKVTPKDGHEPPGSNVVGLLKRISETPQSRSMFLVITDLADTNSKRIAPIEAPHSGISAVILVVPSKPKDTVMTLGKNMPGDQQFERRHNQFQDACKWATIVPYFSNNISELFDRDTNQNPVERSAR